MPNIIILGSYLTDLDATDGVGFQAQTATWHATSLMDGITIYSICFNMYLVGGYKILGGTFGSFYTSYSGLPAHNMILFSFKFQPIDSWDGPGASSGLYGGDHFELNFDTENFNCWALQVFGSAIAQNLCGAGFLDWYPISVIAYVPHSASTLTFTVLSKLDQVTIDESFGFREISMRFYTAATQTKYFCGVSQTALPYSWCPCPTASEFMDPPGTGYCYACDLSCATCTGASANQCTSCDLGKYLTSSNTCASCSSICASCSGSATHCTGCKVGEFLVGNTTCYTSCPYPLTQTFSTITAFCESPCPTSYTLWDQTCATSCNSPLVPQTTSSFLICNYKCKVYEYLYWDGICDTSCPYPLSTTIVNSRQFCNYKCSGATVYLYWDATCIVGCAFPLSPRTAHGSNFCDYPCASTQFLYWNGSCLGSCNFPLVVRRDHVSAVYCDYPCSPTQVLYWDGTCSSSCAYPLTIRSEGSTIVRYFCRFSCNVDQFLYWNGSCLSTCIPSFDLHLS